MADYQVKVIAVKNVPIMCTRLQLKTGRFYVCARSGNRSFDPERKLETEKRPFTFTSLPDCETLEFTIKSYTDHDGVTNQLTQIKPGDRFEISDAWGAIAYQGEGVFSRWRCRNNAIHCHFRDLYSQNKVGSNKLFFSNKTVSDIILKDEFEKMLGDQFFQSYFIRRSRRILSRQN